jgi:predicted phosphodiesterase
MEKRLILGDVHGHFGTIKYIYEEELPDKVIILGDYVDSFTVTPEDCVECLHNVLSLKERHESFKGKDSFIMLIGNHKI